MEQRGLSSPCPAWLPSASARPSRPPRPRVVSHRRPGTLTLVLEA
ncbi:hypothetical protein E2C01_064812 [Portunus trituberculatus]|uniref:Uncharacterized protein n=1 Tax=Portunus trituberculatus TaxID=210409 RepID=A0A5B7HE24_PORTR|nr:hypothetical protein [Portunus trituberculatus]